MTLDQLTPAEAYDLLARRLGTDRLAAEPEAAEEIITRCGRLPLALAIVAAHACAHPAFPLSAIADEVSDSHGSLDAFAGGDGISTDVRAVFSWSYKALPAPAARLFRLLGLHTGPDISVPAAAGLAGLPPREARGLLSELTRAHLLTEHFPGRYTLHDLLRVYAAERVRAEETPEERDLAGRRLLAWYLYTADAAYPHITPNRRRISLEPLPEGCRPLEFTTHEQALAWCETERPHLVAAVHRAAASGHAGIAWRLPAVLWGFFYLRSHIQDWLDTARTGLAAARDAGDREGEAQGLADVAAALRSSGSLDEAIEHLHLALALFQELGDMKGRSAVIGNLGDSYLQAGRLGKAVEYTRRALALDRVEGSVWGRASPCATWATPTSGSAGTTTPSTASNGRWSSCAPATTAGSRASPSTSSARSTIGSATTTSPSRTTVGRSRRTGTSATGGARATRWATSARPISTPRNRRPPGRAGGKPWKSSWNSVIRTPRRSVSGSPACRTARPTPVPEGLRRNGPPDMDLLRS